MGTNTNRNAVLKLLSFTRDLREWDMVHEMLVCDKFNLCTIDH